MKKIILGLVAGFTMLVSCEPEDPLNPSKPAQACFSVSSDNGKTGEEFSFTNCSENATKFSWDFGDGESSTQKEPAHTYSNAGTFEIKLLAGEDLNQDGVLDAKDEPGTTSKTITIINPPQACFTISSESGKVGEGFSFTNCSEHATGLSWDFGDGSTSDQENPHHAYEKEGSYEVVLYAGKDSNSDGVINASDDADHFSKTVTVLPKEISAELTIKDGMSWTVENPNLPVIAGAAIDVYVSYSSFEGGIPDFSAVSDENGKVTLYDLSDGRYYIVVTKDDLSNIVTGLRVEGIFQTVSEIDGAPKQTPEPSVGDFRFTDMNGNGIVDTMDEVPFGDFEVVQGQTTYKEVIIGK